MGGAAWRRLIVRALARRRPEACYLCRTVSSPAPHLSLYYFDSCGYCRRVRQVIEELGVPVELRNIQHSAEHYEALLAARGRRTVPVLRIDRAEGSSEWLPESQDIIAWLRQQHTAGALA